MNSWQSLSLHPSVTQASGPLLLSLSSAPCQLTAWDPGPRLKDASAGEEGSGMRQLQQEDRHSAESVGPRHSPNHFSNVSVCSGIR